VDTADVLQRLYDSEINARIEWVWDGGVQWRLGDASNGYGAEGRVRRWPKRSRAWRTPRRGCIRRVRSRHGGDRPRATAAPALSPAGRSATAAGSVLARYVASL
jgi:hypothetical protein